MNVFQKNSIRLVLAALVWTIAGFVTSAHAERTRWEGRDSAGTTSVYVRDASGGWSEQVTYFGGSAAYKFAEREANRDYVLLYDASRDIWVALYNDRMDLYDFAQGRWVTYYSGRWVEVARAAAPYSMQFTHMKILDDKEGGSGDWRLKATVGAYRDLTIVNKMEGGTGATLGFRSSPLIVTGPSFNVSATVFEYDGGIGAKWEYVGRQDVTIGASGEHRLDFNSSEGRVAVYFRVTPL